MRIVSILTALFAAGSLYAFLIERDAVLGFVHSQLSGGAASDIAPPDEEMEDVPQTSSISDETQENSVSVIAFRSSAREVQSGVTIRGQTEALRFVDVRSQGSGIVISEPKRKGSFVIKDEPICQLDLGTSEAGLAEAKARLEEAKLNNKTANQLLEGGYATETRVNAAKAALETAEAAFERAEDIIDRQTMTAPFDGLLESDAAEFGSLLQMGALCARIIQLDPINFVGFISERDVEKIALGDVARVRFLSGRTVRGDVKFVSRSADSDTRTFRIELSLNNSDLGIRDGLAAEAFIATDSEMAHLLPQSVLTLNDDGLLGVRAVSDSMARFFAITIIRDTTDGVWVTGLPDQVDVIIVGHEYVIDGTPVIATYREGMT